MNTKTKSELMEKQKMEKSSARRESQGDLTIR